MTKKSPNSYKFSEETEDLSILSHQGRSEEAVYHLSEIAAYRDNPYIEALGRILTEDEVLDALANYPDYEEADRQAPSHLRLHLIQLSLGFFAPLPVHLDLEQRFSRLIRAGYMGRNPMALGTWRKQSKEIESMDVPENTPRVRRRSTTAGFIIIGFPGVGKTSAVEEILSLYPQIIEHSFYQGRKFTLKQVVYLKLECPNDGSIKGMCVNFFQGMDNLLGTNYEKRFAGKGHTKDEMIPNMARVAARHGLGVLVIDDIQFLSEAKSGGSRVMLNFFTQLTNTIGVPVVLISTYKGRKVLTGEFSQVRRGTGQGDLVWDRMPEGVWVEETDEENMPGVWQVFLESLWIYQYTLTPCPLTQELSHTLYEETQGITDFAVKVYMLAQIRAITTIDAERKELITPDLIRSVARDSLKTAQRVLNALRSNNLEGLEEIEDIHPIDINPYLQKAQQDLARHENLRSKLQSLVANARNGEEEKGQDKTDGAAPEKTEKKRRGRNSKTPANRAKDRKAKDASYTEGDLRKEVSAGAETGASVYETLQQKGHIQPATEFIKETKIT